jgi:chitinase
MDFSNVRYYLIPYPSVADYPQICNVVDDPVFPGTALPNCSFLASDIQECQANGKIVTISIGGQIGDVDLASDSQAESFADTVWNIFLGGSSDIRPFGNATFDGYDKARHCDTYLDLTKTIVLI